MEMMGQWDNGQGDEEYNIRLSDFDKAAEKQARRQREVGPL